MKSQIKDHEKLASPQGRDILPPPKVVCLVSWHVSLTLLCVRLTSNARDSQHLVVGPSRGDGPFYPSLWFQEA